MKIGELAAHSGLAQSRIRFYEASGLIQAQRQSNGYREYAPQTLRLLGVITAAQSAGFTLDEIRSLLPGAGPGQWNHEELLAKLRAKIAEMTALQKRLRDNKARLLAVIEQIENKPAELQCGEHAERVMASISGVHATAGRVGSQAAPGRSPERQPGRRRAGR